jgi:hypothetical protein
VSTLAFVVVAIVAAVLAAFVAASQLRAFHARRRRTEQRAHREVRRVQRMDPGTERRAERRARALLRSIVNRDEWDMYRDLGFIRVIGRNAVDSTGTGAYCYLIYPHKPIVAYLPGSHSLMSEYCVEFPDHDERVYGPKLPDSDDVLAKWMMIRADEEDLIRRANMHLPGRQVDPQQVRRDLWRLNVWERERRGRVRVAGDSGSVAPADLRTSA